MKKLVLMLAVVFSVSLFSCDGNGAKGSASDTTDTTNASCSAAASNVEVSASNVEVSASNVEVVEASVVEASVAE